MVATLEPREIVAVRTNVRKLRSTPLALGVVDLEDLAEHRDVASAVQEDMRHRHREHVLRFTDAEVAEMGEAQCSEIESVPPVRREPLLQLVVLRGRRQRAPIRLLELERQIVRDLLHGLVHILPTESHPQDLVPLHHRLPRTPERRDVDAVERDRQLQDVEARVSILQPVVQHSLLLSRERKHPFDRLAQLGNTVHTGRRFDRDDRLMLLAVRHRLARARCHAMGSSSDMEAFNCTVPTKSPGLCTSSMIAG